MSLALSVPFAAGAATAPKTLVGTIGQGFTIGLKFAGKKATKVKAGVVPILDQRQVVDSRLSRPGAGRRTRWITGVGFTGSKSVVIKLKKGTYTFKCDPHAWFMHGSFTVS